MDDDSLLGIDTFNSTLLNIHRKSEILDHRVPQESQRSIQIYRQSVSGMQNCRINKVLVEIPETINQKSDGFREM